MTGTLAAAQAGPSRRWRRWAGWGGLVVAVVLVGLAAGPVKEAGPAFDPRSASGNGTKAAVLLARQLGATVELTTAAPASDVDVTVVLSDRLSEDRRRELADWALGGGTLVVADPDSALQASAPQRGPSGVSGSTLSGPCPAAGLGDVRRVATGGSLLLRPRAGAVGCFPARGGFLLLSVDAGRGRLVALGGAGPFTNSELAKEDNSVLVADLLLPHPASHVAVMLATPVGGGRQSLWRLLGRPVRLGLIQLLVAALVVGYWRVRRLGPPVEEAVPVEIPGSELTVAVGNLWARAGHRDAAASRLRGGLRRSLGRRLGLGPAAPASQIADAAAVRTGADRTRLSLVLEDRPVAGDAELVELAQSVERTREEVARGARN